MNAATAISLIDKIRDHLDEARRLALAIADHGKTDRRSAIVMLVALNISNGLGCNAMAERTLHNLDAAAELRVACPDAYIGAIELAQAELASLRCQLERRVAV